MIISWKRFSFHLIITKRVSQSVLPVFHWPCPGKAGALYLFLFVKHLGLQSKQPKRGKMFLLNSWMELILVYIHLALLTTTIIITIIIEFVCLPLITASTNNNKSALLLLLVRLPLYILYEQTLIVIVDKLRFIHF